MSHRVGVDLVEIRRIEELLEKKSVKFVERICSPKEQEILKRVKGPRIAQKLASIFALKEAFSKAVGTGIGKDLKIHDIEVSYLESGAPQLKYVGDKLKLTGDIACSVSHEAGLLIAIVSIDGKLTIRRNKK